jgi:hypothetical protein
MTLPARCQPRQVPNSPRESALATPSCMGGKLCGADRADQPHIVTALFSDECGNNALECGVDLSGATLGSAVASFVRVRNVQGH